LDRAATPVSIFLIRKTRKIDIPSHEKALRLLRRVCG
jgi:hypothetical protein